MKKRYQDILNSLTNHEDSNSKLNDRILIIDGFNRFIAVFTMVPALNDNGDHVGGVIGFLKSLAWCIRRFNPTRCIVVFDGAGGSLRRKKIFPEYKANRINKTSFNRFSEFSDIESEEESMRRQVKRVVEYLSLLPVTTISIDNIEADDVIAHITKQLSDGEIIINSTDRDYYQLVNNRITVFSPVTKVVYDEKTIIEKFNIHIDNMLLYKIFETDLSDNIPGVKGIGLKSLIKHFPDITRRKILLDELLKISEDEIKKESKYKIFKTIIDNRLLLERNFKIMQLEDVNISASIKSSIRMIYNTEPPKLDTWKFKKLFAEDSLHLILKNLDDWLQSSFYKLNKYTK